MDIITIDKSDTDGLFIVKQGYNKSNELTYADTIGLVSALIMPEERPCLNWMHPLMKIPNKIKDVTDGTILVPDNIHIFRRKKDGCSDPAKTYGDGLYIGMDQDICLFGKYHDTFMEFANKEDGFEKVQCKLIEANEENVIPGDTLCNNNFNSIKSYYKFINGAMYYTDGSFIYILKKPIEIPYKIVPIDG